MSAVLDALWQQMEPHAYVTREEFERNMESWTLEPVEREGMLVAVFATQGPELHFTTFKPGGRTFPASLRLIRERLEPLLERYGFVRTRTPKDEPRQRRFNERLGFVAVGEDEFFIFYRLDNPAWRHACP
jgi:hypothetical protein